MRKKWTKLISLLCVTALLAGLLVVPAAAAEPATFELANADIGTGTLTGEHSENVTHGKFTLVCASSSGKMKVSDSIGTCTWDEATFGKDNVLAGTKMCIDFEGASTLPSDSGAGKRLIQFTTEYPAVVTVWYTTKGNRSTPKLYNNSTKADVASSTVKASTSGDYAGLVEFDTKAAGTFSIYNDSVKIAVYQVRVKEYASEPSLTAASDTEVYLDLTETKEATLKVTPANAGDATVAWTSSDSAQEKVGFEQQADKNECKVTAKQVTEEGSPVTITATLGETGKTVEFKVHVSSHVHQFTGEGTVTKQPTCTQQGTKEIPCSVPECEEKQTVTVDALGHREVGDPGVKTEGQKDATCTADGSTGKILCNRDNGDEGVCTQVVQEATAIPRTGHTFDAAGGKCKNAACDVTRPDTLEIKFTGKTVSDSDKGYITVVGSTVEYNNDGNLSYNGDTLSDYLKMNSKADLTFKAPGDGTLKLYMGKKNDSETPSSCKLSINSTNVTIDEDWTATQEVTNGESYEIKRGGSSQEYRLYVLVWIASTPSHTTDPTPAPTFTKATYDLVKDDLTSGHVAFTLAAAPAAETTYKLYAKEGGAEAALAQKTISSGTDALSFEIADTTKLPTPDEPTATFYVTATETDKDESATRTPVTVKYVLVESISFVHNHHSVYENGNEVVGDPENKTPDHPKMWELVASALPRTATDPKISYRSEDGHIATVAVQADGKVVVTAVAKGTAKIFAEAENNGTNGKVPAECTIDVMPYINEVTIEPAEPSVEMGKSISLTATVKEKDKDGSDYQDIDWSVTGDAVEVDAHGVVTAKKVGEAQVTATSYADEKIIERETQHATEDHDPNLIPKRAAVKATVTVKVEKGTPAFTMTVDHETLEHTGGDVAVTLEGLPEGVTAKVTCEGAEPVTGSGANWTVTLPANDTEAEKTYTINAVTDADDNWKSATVSKTIIVAPEGAVILKAAPKGNTTSISAVAGSTDPITLAVEASVTGGSITPTYTWKHGEESLEGETGASLTLNKDGAAVTEAMAGAYTCTVAAEGATPASEDITFTVTITKAKVTAITVTLAEETETAKVALKDDALTITGPTQAILKVATTPAGHTVIPRLSNDSLANMKYDTDGTLTVTPLRASTSAEGPATITLTSGSVIKTITLTVNKLPAPAALTEADVTVTQPAAEGATGSIEIKAPVEGTTYLYSATNVTTWTEFTVKDGKVIAEGLAPAIYEVREKVDTNFQDITTAPLRVTIKAYEAPAPVKPDTTALQTAIADAADVYQVAQDTANLVPDGTTAAEVEKDKVVYPQSVADALIAAYDAAKAALDAATQAEVDAAAKTLTDAVAAFNAAKITGTKTDTPVTPEKPDTTALQAAIATAEAKLKDVVPSADGKDVTTDKTWATQEAIDTLKAAIETAKAALTAETQEAVDAAAKTLTDATDAFTPATGEKTDDEPDQPDEPVAVTGVILTGRDTVQVGETITLTANVLPDNATDKHVTWTSSDESILTVSDGVVVGVKAGKATVTATTDNGGFSDSMEITVTSKSGGAATGTHTGGSTTTTGNHTQTTPPGSQTDVNENGDKVTTVTSTAGGKTVTVTDEAGEVVAKVVIPAQTPDLAYKFEDVPAGHWAEAAINAMAAMNVVQGVSQTQHIFDMNSAITRGAMAQMLFNLSQGKDGMTGAFTDTRGSWCADAVAWAASAGVVNGLSETVFAPDQAITREQLATMLYRYAKLLDLDVSAKADLGAFVDAGEVDSWASEAMTWAVAAGLLQGKGAGDLDPNAAASRAETATIMSRFLQLI